MTAVGIDMSRVEKVDFSYLTDESKGATANKKSVQDWYDRASTASDEWYAEYCYNMALYHDHVRARGATENFFHKNKRNNVIKESTLGFLEGTPEDSVVLFDEEHSKQDDSPKKERKWGEYLERQKYLQHVGMPDPAFVSDYTKESVEDVICEALYAKMVRFAEISSLHKLIMAWYLYDNGYEQLMSEERKEYWETTFEELDILYEATNGKVRPANLIAHVDGMKWHELTAVQEDLQFILRDFRPTMRRRAKKAVMVEEDAD